MIDDLWGSRLSPFFCIHLPLQLNPYQATNSLFFFFLNNRSFLFLNHYCNALEKGDWGLKVLFFFKKRSCYLTGTTGRGVLDGIMRSSTLSDLIQLPSNSKIWSKSTTQEPRIVWPWRLDKERDDGDDDDDDDDKRDPVTLLTPHQEADMSLRQPTSTLDRYEPDSVDFSGYTS